LNLSPILLAGPTAVGKTEVALRLAETLGGEIVSVDSMQVYRGLDIGTAKPTAAERARVPHHLLDIVGLTEAFDAAQFVRLARLAVADIQSRGRVPILCGGTGLYFKAFLEGLSETPDSDPKLRAEVEATPLPDLLRELAEQDPLTYEHIDRQNPRRVIRAVEVLRLTGKPPSEQRTGWGSKGEKARREDGGEKMAGAERAFGLARDIVDLHRRIEVRVDDMFARGLVAETERLLQEGLAQNRTALQALGYRQVVEHLQGLRSLPETIALVKSRTHKFARRQRTWFRGQMRLQWVMLAPGEKAEMIVEKLRAALPG
jgi:tRNA dimethylallyltransferase